MGRLVQPFALKVPHRHHWLFACKAEHRMKPKIRRFEDWLGEADRRRSGARTLSRKRKGSMTELDQRNSSPKSPQRPARWRTRRPAVRGNAAFRNCRAASGHAAFPPMQIVSADEIECIHRASLQVLSEIGMDFMLPEARDLLKKAGAEDRRRARALRSRDDRRTDRASAPSRIHCSMPAIPAHNLRIGGDNMVIRHGGAARPTAPTWTAAAAPATRRTTATSSSLRRYFNCHRFRLAAIRSSRSISTPRSATSNALRDMAILTDKPFHAYSLGKERNRRRHRDRPHRPRHHRTSSSSASRRSSPSSTPTRR